MLDYTTDNGFLPHIKCDSVADAVSQLVDRLTAAGDVADGDGLIAEVLRREKDGSTAIGGGLVIPHGRYEGVAAVRVAVATLAVPLVIPAADDQPVDIVLLLVGPTGQAVMLASDVLSVRGGLQPQDALNRILCLGLSEEQEGKVLGGNAVELLRSVGVEI